MRLKMDAAASRLLTTGSARGCIRREGELREAVEKIVSRKICKMREKQEKLEVENGEFGCAFPK
jgi:hypothetical protein